MQEKPGAHAREASYRSTPHAITCQHMQEKPGAHAREANKLQPMQEKLTSYARGLCGQVKRQGAWQEKRHADKKRQEATRRQDANRSDMLHKTSYKLDNLQPTCQSNAARAKCNGGRVLCRLPGACALAHAHDLRWEAAVS